MIDAVTVSVAGFVPESGRYWADIVDDENNNDIDSLAVKLSYVKIVNVATMTGTYSQVRTLNNIGSFYYNPFGNNYVFLGGSWLY